MDYGEDKYGKNLYGGGVVLAPYLTPTVPVAIEIFDSLGTRKSFYQTGSSDLLSTEFSLAETGCKDFRLQFASIKNIDKNDKVKIKVFTSDLYFFSGVVREVPIEGSSENKYEYSGFGMNDYFQRLLTGNKNYLNKTVNYIVYDLLTTVILPNTLITVNASKIDALLTVVTDCTMYFVTIADALKDLQRIASSDGNDYLVGVDEANEFFFRARSQEVKATLHVGKRGRYGIPSYEPKDDYEAKTKLHVIRDDGTYYGAVTSTEGNDIFEDKIQAPAGLSDADIANWALGILKDNEVNQRSASVNWKIEIYYPDLLKADGYLRIVSNSQQRRGEDIVPSGAGDGNAGDGLAGGEGYTGYIIDDTLKIIDVKYSITPGSANRNITLGARPAMLESQILDVRKKLVELTINLGR
jgi:hypothetical protein